jgi:hypothetical protein
MTVDREATQDGMEDSSHVSAWHVCGFSGSRVRPEDLLAAAEAAMSILHRVRAADLPDLTWKPDPWT